MNSVKNLLLLALLVGVTATSCRKKGIEVEYNFVNHLTKSAKVTIYENKQDYDFQVNPFLSFTVEANNTYRLPFSSFQEGHTYYIDWYTDSFIYNNWVIDKYTNKSPYVAYTPGSANNKYSLEPNYKSPSRITFLNGYDTVTHWKAVDAYSYTEAAGYKSTWASLSANLQYKEMTFRKNGIVSYTFKNTNGTTATNNYEFMVHVANRAYVEIPLSNGTTFSLIGGELPTAEPPNYSSLATDTVMAIIDETGYQYMMVKQ